MDNLAAHKERAVETALAEAGLKLLYLPRYSPELSSIEPGWSKVKSALRYFYKEVTGTVRASKVAAEQNRAQIGAAPTNNKATGLVADIGDHSRPGSPLRLAPNGSEPGLPLSRQAGRAIVMVQLDETGRNHVVAPSAEVEEAGVTAVAEALFVVSSRI
jgi:hypothetical protein